MIFPENKAVTISPNMFRKAIRLQGIAFRNTKKYLTPFAYSVSNRGNICVYYTHQYNFNKYTHFLNDEEKKNFNSDGLTKYQMLSKEQLEELKRQKELDRLKKEEERQKKHKEIYHEPSRAYYITRSTAYVLDGLLIKWRHFSENPNDINHVLHHKASSCEQVTEEEMDYILSLDNVVIEQDGAISLKNFTLPTYGRLKECEE